MVNISITANEIATNPLIIQAPNAYVLNLGSISKTILPSAARSNTNPADPVRDGGQFFLALRPYESFPIENEIFEVLVNNAVNGGEDSFLSQLIYFINRNIIEVKQDNAAALTSKQVLTYTAP